MSDSDILFVLTDMMRYTDQHRDNAISLSVMVYGNGRMITDMFVDGDWLEIAHTDILNTDIHDCEHLGRLIVYRLYIEGVDGKYSVPLNGFECSRCGKLIG